MLVRIYRNLHTKTLSMQTKVNGKWKVIGHPTSVSLNCRELIVNAMANDYRDAVMSDVLGE